jgi:hypothetical protein
MTGLDWIDYHIVYTAYGTHGHTFTKEESELHAAVVYHTMPCHTLQYSAPN